MTKTYSITKNGSDYLVGTEQQNVLRLSSRRKAAKVVTEASELLTNEEGALLQDQAELRREAENVE